MQELLGRVLKVWEKRLPLTPAQLQALGEEAYARGWGLAGIWEQKFLERIQGSLTTAIAKGSTYSEWTQNEGQRILDGFGAGVSTYRGGQRWDPWYSELVMRNATQASFAGGRYSAMWAPEWQQLAPFWRYYATLDDRTRPEHSALHGKVFRKDDPSARAFLPPWGHACRCQAQELTLAEVEDAGYQITDGNRIPLLPIEGGGTIGRPPGGWDIDRVTANSSRVLKAAVQSPSVRSPSTKVPPPAGPSGTPSPNPAPAVTGKRGKGWRPAVEQVETAIQGRSIEHAAAFDKDGRTLVPPKRGAASYVDFSKAEVAAMRGGVLTHNHPKGMSFSAADVKLAWVADLFEIRAVSEINGQKVIHRFIRPQLGWASGAKNLADLALAYSSAVTVVSQSAWYGKAQGLLTSRKMSLIQFERERSGKVMKLLARALKARYERR